MKKILDYNVVKTCFGTCDFCQKKVDRAILGSCFFNIAEPDGYYISIDGWKYTFFGNRIIKGEPKSRRNYKVTNVDIEPLICFDCVKEFSKLNI